MIQLENITYSYNNRIVLDDISFNIKDGQCTFIDGPNGCGKSTLFRIINGLEFPIKGKYYLDGQLINQKTIKNEEISKNLHKKIGYLFQDSEMQLFTKSVEDEIAFGLFQLGYDDKKVHEIVEKYISLLELEDVRKQAPFSLSGGEKKRCAIAAILSMNPDILILDEPFNNLDEDGQEWMLSFIKNLKKENKTLVIASHQKNFMELISDNIVKMDKHHHIVQIIER